VESPRVYVGNLSYDVSEQDLQELFKGIGGVRNVEIVYNRSTHRSKGYGFVEMLHMDEAMRAVEVLHDQPFMGRKLTVSGAKSKGQDEREDRDERPERPERSQRPVVVAPRPAHAVAAAPVETAAAEPVIQTIVETVADAPDAPVDSMPDAPEDFMPDAPVETVAENAEATAEAKSEVV
jgi:RNA recognition motif-containing protein